MKISFHWQIDLTTKKEKSAHNLLLKIKNILNIPLLLKKEDNKFMAYCSSTEELSIETAYFQASLAIAKLTYQLTTSGPTIFPNGTFECDFFAGKAFCLSGIDFIKLYVVSTLLD